MPCAVIYIYCAAGAFPAGYGATKAALHVRWFFYRTIAKRAPQYAVFSLSAHSILLYCQLFMNLFRNLSYATGDKIAVAVERDAIAVIF